MVMESQPRPPALAKVTDKPLIFGVDLDGVCGDFYSAIREVASEWLGVPIDNLTPDVSFDMSEWKLDALGGYLAMHHFAVTQRDLFRTMPPIPGAGPVLRRLSKHGVRIRIITHRLHIPNFHRTAVEQTIDWLDKHGIPYWDLCFMNQKSDVAADLYIDDSPKNVRSLRAEVGTDNVIVFGNSTNKGMEAPRVESWDGVERIVLAHLAQRQGATAS
jgi:5'(3')-deoxyribonucleotidase